MSHGLDQYLANRLTNEHVFQVVTDPKLADAVFSDRVGDGSGTSWRPSRPLPSPRNPRPPRTAADQRRSQEGRMREPTTPAG